LSLSPLHFDTQGNTVEVGVAKDIDISIAYAQCVNAELSLAALDTEVLRLYEALN
jgi:hypothetical protein